MRILRKVVNYEEAIQTCKPKDFLYKVYTEEGGVKEHNRNQQVIGILKFAGIVWSIQKLGRIVDKIERLPIKTLEKKDEEPPC